MMFVILNIKRNGKKINVLIKRIEISSKRTTASTGDDYKLGIWIRNDMQGVGTLTFYDPEKNIYGAFCAEVLSRADSVR